MRIWVWSRRNEANIRKGEAAEVAQALGNQEQYYRPANQEPDRVDQAVKAGREHEGGDFEERGGRHIVAGDRETILKRGNAATGGEKVGCGFRLHRRTIRDPEGAEHEQRENADRSPVQRLLLKRPQIGAGGYRDRGSAAAPIRPNNADVKLRLIA